MNKYEYNNSNSKIVVSRIRLYFHNVVLLMHFRKRHDIEWDFSYAAFQLDIAVFLEI